MKKNIQIIIAGLFILCTGCTFEEANIFDESSAVRIDKAKKEYTELLCSSPNGWVMDYFPTDDQKGYTFLMKFNASTKVEMMSKNEITKNVAQKDSCLFELIADNGPVLTFNTFSSANTFHVFADPEDIASTSDNERGIGYGGDYEFIVISAQEDEILLKGKKRGVYIPLRRLPENQDWEAYLKSLDQMNTTMFNKDVPQLSMVAGDSVFTLKEPLSHIFKIVPKGGDPIADRKDFPFIVTDYGIHLVKPYTVGEAKVQNFQLSEDKNSLVCTDEGVNASIQGPAPRDYFFDAIDVAVLNKNLGFTTGDNDMSASVRAAYNVINQSLSEKNRVIKMLSFDEDKKLGYSLAFKVTNNADKKDADVLYSYTFTRESENEIFISFNGMDAITDQTAIVFYNTFTGFDQLFSLINGKFTVTTLGSALQPTTLKLTSISNPDVWFMVTVK